MPTGPDTLFVLFSNTKVLVSSAVWLLVEEGIISLNDPVAEYMPAFAANGKGGCFDCGRRSVRARHPVTEGGAAPMTMMATPGERSGQNLEQAAIRTLAPVGGRP